MVGTAAPYLGWWHITTRPLVAGEVIAAVQEVGGNESFPSRRPVTVQYLTQAADPMPIPEISQPV
ncbi:hypothetical protein O1Q96_23890 [Streptomyces sp. Qhu-G9]|uniref:hypothetical protein n=1 Tax=Streptomyces sp. Qhu-G9 TaxID=3452799 RepID=UPI0022AC59D8|nr:hypothetical protein [Streptomyces aurantiacus]WAU82516.1 hypothetical protein O1Q96_23890 [Streptomyces aurantiacus]